MVSGWEVAQRRRPDPSRLATRRLVVDEAWLLMRGGEGARFLFRMSKAARKRHAGLTVITRDVADLLGTDLGEAVVANAASQILLKQAPQAIDDIGDRFGLTAGKRRLLLAARIGQELLISGSNRTSFEPSPPAPSTSSARRGRPTAMASETTCEPAVHPTAPRSRKP